MAKKKVVKKSKKKVVKKKIVIKKTVAKKRISQKVKPKSKKVTKTKKRKATIKAPSRNISLVLKNLIFFTILFILSLVLYMATSNPTYVDVFMLLAVIFGAIILAFVIILLVFSLLRAIKD